MDTVCEFKCVSAGEDVEKLVVLIKILEFSGPLSTGLIKSPLLVVPINVVLLIVLNVVITVL